MGIAMHSEVLQGVVKVCFFLDGTDIVAHPLAKEIWTKYRNKPLSDMLGTYGAGFTMGMAQRGSAQDRAKGGWAMTS